MANNIRPAVIDGIERLCDNCNSVDIHLSEPFGSYCREYKPQSIEPGTPAFDAILARARELGLPQHYTSDLHHDYQILSGRTRRPGDTVPLTFLWGVYEMGTHMIRLDPSDGGGSPGYLLRSIMRNVGPNLRWFYWDGSALRDVTFTEAEDLANDRNYGAARQLAA